MRKLFYSIIKTSPPHVALLFLTLSQVLYSKHVKYGLDRKLGPFCQDESNMMFVASLFRLLTYRNGIAERQINLLQEYLIDSFLIDEITDNSLIIDCGANVGDFSLGIYRKCPKRPRIISFEPSPAEFNSLLNNTACIKEIESFNIALSNKCGSSLLQIKSDTADNSLDGVANFSEAVEVQIQSFDAFYQCNPTLSKLECILLFKLEAEGHEYEILLGMKESLPRIKYITCDLGPEKAGHVSTAPESLNLLYSCGFTILSHNPHRSCFLLVNSSYVD